MTSETRTRFDIEMQRIVYLAELSHDRMTDEKAIAWVPVGHIEMDDETRYNRDVFTAWVGEQSTEPPLGLYRLIEHSRYGSSVVEFEIRETRDRVIERHDPGAEKYKATIHQISEALGDPA